MRFLPLSLVMLLAAGSADAADITVSAAASLSDAFKEIAADYQKQYPDARVKLNTAASGVLLQQLAQGAPVDVLATADEATMNKAVQQKLINASSRKTFALNSLVLITPKRQPGVKKLADLTQASVKRIAIGKPESVPAGNYAKAALEKAGLFRQLQPKFVYTTNVRQALDYVSRSEADAGFVYRTDAVSRQAALNIVQNVPTQTPVSYPIAVTTASRQQAEAQRFTAYVLSGKGRSVLQKYGFLAP